MKNIIIKEPHLGENVHYDMSEKNKDSDQPAQLNNLIRVYPGYSMDSQKEGFFKLTQKILV